MQRKGKIAVSIILFLGVSLVLIAVLIKPSDQGKSYEPYFEQMNQVLQEARIGKPCIFLDLDRLDHNIATLMEQMPENMDYRIVTKSLPSLQLIEYIMEKTGTRKLMAFHEPFIALMIKHFGNKVDILLGKPLSVESAENILIGLTPQYQSFAVQSIQWLVDTPERLKYYLEFAAINQWTLRINLEIDVGLHRGGVDNTDELNYMLETFQDNKEYLEFTGYMGYDGHVPYVPSLLGSKESAIVEALEEAMAVYSSFLEFGKTNYPNLFTGELTFNSGGSKTYSLYHEDYPVNDLAIGSAMLKPSTFMDTSLVEHEHALYIAAPIIKIEKGLNVPFADPLAEVIEWWDPNLKVSYYIYGGGWAADLVSPEGLRFNPFTSSDSTENYLPNQSQLNGSLSINRDIGDFVFFLPKQSDALSQFERILLIRDFNIVGEWYPFETRY